MSDPLADSQPQPGDQIQIKAGAQTGHRAIVQTVSAEHLGVELADGTRLTVRPAEITNYSLAARRANATRALRGTQVGRPARPRSGAPSPRRLARTIRLSTDIDLLLTLIQRTHAYTDWGYPSLEAALEDWIRAGITQRLTGAAGTPAVTDLLRLIPPTG